MPGRVDHRHVRVTAELLVEQVRDERAADPASEHHDPRRHRGHRAFRIDEARVAVVGTTSTSSWPAFCDPGRDVGLRALVAREHLDHVADLSLADRADQGHQRARARHAARVDRAGDVASSSSSLPPSDERDGAVGLHEERGDAPDAVDHRVEVVLRDAEHLHRVGAGVDVDLADVLRLTEELAPVRRAVRPASRAAPSSPASGATPWSLRMRSARNASSAQYCRKTLTLRPIAAAPTASTAAACSLSSVPENSTTANVSLSTIVLLRIVGISSIRWGRDGGARRRTLHDGGFFQRGRAVDRGSRGASVRR